MLRMTYRGGNPGGLPDGVTDIPVENPAVRDDDDGVENLISVLFQPDQLVGQPGDGIAFPASGRMLDQVALAHTMLGSMLQQAPHHVDLVVAGPDLFSGLLSRLFVADLNQLGIVLENVGQTFPGQHLAPQVGGLESVRIGRIAGTIVPATVEWQEP